MVHSSSALARDLPGVRDTVIQRERERERERLRETLERKRVWEGRKVYSNQKAMNEVDAVHDCAGGRFIQQVDLRCIQ